MNIRENLKSIFAGYIDIKEQYLNFHGIQKLYTALPGIGRYSIITLLSDEPCC